MCRDGTGKGTMEGREHEGREHAMKNVQPYI
jgi:hypothetical protein